MTTTMVTEKALKVNPRNVSRVSLALRAARLRYALTDSRRPAVSYAPAAAARLDYVPAGGGWDNLLDMVERDALTDSTAAAVYALARAMARAVLRKCIDPQRKTAPIRLAVSDNGYNPVMLDMLDGIQRDADLLSRTVYAVEQSVRHALDKDGYYIEDTGDAELSAACAAICAERLTDGSDMVQACALAILEWARRAQAAGVAHWLRAPITVRRLGRHVLHRLTDKADVVEQDSTPIQEIFRAGRREVELHRSARYAPGQSCVYVQLSGDDAAGDALYYRCGRWLDVGGEQSDGQYTAGLEQVWEYYATLERLDLTPRQREVIELRVRGYSDSEIGRYLSTSRQAVERTAARVADKARAIGLSPRPAVDADSVGACPYNPAVSCDGCAGKDCTACAWYNAAARKPSTTTAARLAELSARKTAAAPVKDSGRSAWRYDYLPRRK